MQFNVKYSLYYNHKLYIKLSHLYQKIIFATFQLLPNAFSFALLSFIFRYYLDDELLLKHGVLRFFLTSSM